ncbi:MAG: glycerol-3-phosphate acyltransferase [Synechococcales bacterium]|nr:glycerol-3-phosphate acyltransferase [Synechococcales bacterium]
MWEIVALLLVCPILGGLPVIDWIHFAFTGERLAKRGTGNISVSAAFYHGGRWVGILAVLSEAAKGIGVVLLARSLFPEEPAWEVGALVLLVIGRYWIGRGAGVTNVVWGYIVHDWRVAFLIALIGGIGFTVLRERHLGRLGILVLIPVITGLLHPHDPARLLAALALSLLIGWIYYRIPDDLDLPTSSAQRESRQLFRFFRGDRAILTLDQDLQPTSVGGKAATLAQLRRWGYPVPEGWVLPPGDDPAPLIDLLDPAQDYPLVVRSSAIGEDSESASAAGQYDSILNVTTKAELQRAIAQCQASYNQPSAVRYRSDRQVPDQAMAVLIQVQIKGVFSGVAFSRDPIDRQGDAVLVEALPGAASQIVSGRVTPETYRVAVATTAPVSAAASEKSMDHHPSPDWLLPDSLTLPVVGEGNIPPRLIQQVAYLTRQIENRYHGIPQDVEWSFDGQTLWVLQARPITTLLPIWTRKIAAEVIPGFIRPLTWSINQPLTCGVWGEIFSLVLGDRARGLDFSQTATLHHSVAYFNATLLGAIFNRMGLPAESLEFLTRGAKFSRPPLQSTLQAIPGLLRLLSREWLLREDFDQARQQAFDPYLKQLAQSPPNTLTAEALLGRVEQTLDILKQVTYYNILAPLSVSFRQAIFRVKDEDMDYSRAPEVAALHSLQALAANSRSLLPTLGNQQQSRSMIFATLGENTDGQAILSQLDRFLAEYGYLSEVATDIAVPTWSEDPRPVRELFVRFLHQRTRPRQREAVDRSQQGWKVRRVQHRLDLRAEVAEKYNRLLADLRWSLVALEQIWLSHQRLQQPGDVFFLEIDEVRRLVASGDDPLWERVPRLVEQRRSQWAEDSRVANIPILVYGNEPPKATQFSLPPLAEGEGVQLRGIGASPGQAIGQVVILDSLYSAVEVDKDTILVVPYTDSGWAARLAQAGGLIAEVGGRLSHGAIIAREYGIPAVMDVQNARQLLKNGQRVQIDGQQGTVTILPG